MIRFCVWLLERSLRPDLAEHVIGDLVEQQQQGMWWALRETLSALWHLHARPRVGAPFLRSVLADLRIAARLLARSPAFAFVSVLTLALAIGATTAIFSVIDPVLLQPLPYPGANRLVLVWERNRDGSRDNVGFATYRDLVAESRTPERAAAIGDWQPTLSDNGEPERVQGDRVSWTYFGTLGVQPVIGRDFTAQEDQPGNNQVVILSYGLWQRRYGGASSILGRAIFIDGKPMTVVGVMPASFENAPTPTAKIWRVLGYLNQDYACRTCRHLRMIARLRPNVTLASSQAEMNRLQARLARAYPKDYASVGMQVGRVQSEITLATRAPLLALGGAVVLVLLIAVANVVSLQLARAIRRAEEFAVRGALGASR
ncbi:MAG: ABC transporter permease, partial [Gemmatimonadales bacterium]